ncbi:glycosyltransferase family 4 protein [Microbacterium chocolatum]|uniref:glycosyltransferase family 4 protein n=1 Tax=Microbacterium aurantiacum TaxID=162393 RepID=UPI00338FEB19
MTSTSPVADRAFVVPADLGGPSGGSAYNTAIIAALRAGGVDVVERGVPGAWPRPTEADLDSLAEALASAREVVVDGIVACAAPDRIADAAAAGIRVVILVHLPLPAESGLSEADADTLARGERAALEAADLILCTSAWARDDLRARYDVAAEVVRPGVDTADPAIGSTPPRLLILGAVTPRKNAVVALSALEPLRDRAWEVVVAGPARDADPYVARVTGAVEALGVDRARVVGAVSGRRRERLWRETDLLLLPSLVEPYGMVVTEGLARGIPALVAAGTGAVEALVDGTESGAPLPGLALDPDRPAEWTDAIARWLDDADLSAAWRAAASDARSRLRGWPHAATQLRDLLRW